VAALASDHNDQREAIAFLEGCESHGMAVSTVERIDTHAAMIFLAGERAYKLKRSIRFSYLDLSTIERREAACRAEVELNRRTAADLYLGVHSVTREDDGSVAFDGAGIVLDWVVVMRRFDQELLFERLAARGALNVALMEQLSAEIARFHAAAEVTPGRGGRASIESVIAGNDENLALAPRDAFSRELCTALVRRWRAQLDRHAALLDRRDEGGKVRRCHGDLHLRNICLWRGRPTLFDCIEFSERLACIDVLYDLAFLLMDLEHRSLRAFANQVFNAYLDRNDETDGIAALPLMMSLRAAIRAHTGVAAAHAQSHPERRLAIVDEAREYLSLACRMLHEQRACLIALGGLSGSGKSTLARALAPTVGSTPGARLIHTDALRKRLFGVAKGERLESEAYEPAVNERVYQLQREGAAASLRSGYSAIVDGVFAQPQERAAIAAVAGDFGAAFAGLWLAAPEEILRERVAGRSGDMSDATVNVLATQLSIDVGRIDWTRIASGGSADETLALASRALTSAFTFNAAIGA
jgi:aminoglycoside phosphotransferase family enzyme/predicted kinase